MSITQKLKQSFLCFSLFFGIAAISFFIAYNWSALSNILKIGIPFSLFLFFSILWFLFQKKEFYRRLSLFAASFLIGSVFAVFGQVYQTGADPYHLFLSWGIFLLIFSFVEPFYPTFILQITVFCIATMLYTKLYYGNEAMFFTGGFFLFLILFLYLFLQQKKNFPIKIYFLYLLSIFSSLFLTIGAFYSNVSSYNFLNPYITIFSSLTLILLFFMGKYFNNKSVEVFSILSFPFILCSFFIKIPDFLIATFLSFIVFGAALYGITKYYQNSFFIRASMNFLKFFLFIVLIAFVAGVTFLIFHSMHILSFLSVLLFFASIIIPQTLDWKRDKTEFVSFMAGLFILLFYLIFEWRFSVISTVFISFAVFLFFYLRFYARIFDFMLVPLITSYVIILYKEYDFYNFTWLCALYLIILFFDLFQKNWGEQKQRILLGLKVSTLFLLGGFALFLRDRIFFLSLPSISLLLGILILAVLYQMLWENKTIYFFMAGLFLSLVYQTIMLPGIGLGIFFFLASLWKNNKYFLLCSILFLGNEVFLYYYSLDFSLLYTSQSFGKLSLLLFLAFLVSLKGGSNEKNISSL